MVFLQEVDFFFGGKMFSGKNTATFSDCTLCIIKPHAIIEGILILQLFLKVIL